MNKIIKVGATVLSALTVTAGAVTTVSEVVQQVNYEQVYEYNYVQKVNWMGETVEMTAEEADELFAFITGQKAQDELTMSPERFEELLQILNIEVTPLEDTSCEKNSNIVYFGAVDSLNPEDIDLGKLDRCESSELRELKNNDSKVVELRGLTIKAMNQYPVLIIPQRYELRTATASGIVIDMDSFDANGYSIYYFPEKSIDGFSGGIIYNFTLGNAK